MSKERKLRFTKVRDVKSPTRAHESDCAIDFFVPNDYPDSIIEPGCQILIPSGVKVSIPYGYCLLGLNKSGVATKKSLVVGACIGADTEIITDKGVFKAKDLTKEFVNKNNILVLSYNFKKMKKEFCDFDGFRENSMKECIKVEFEDGTIEIYSKDHLIYDENSKSWMLSEDLC